MGLLLPFTHSQAINMFVLELPVCPRPTNMCMHVIREETCYRILKTHIFFAITLRYNLQINTTKIKEYNFFLTENFCRSQSEQIIINLFDQYFLLLEPVSLCQTHLSSDTSIPSVLISVTQQR